MSECSNEVGWGGVLCSGEFEINGMELSCVTFIGTLFGGPQLD